MPIFLLVSGQSAHPNIEYQQNAMRFRDARELPLGDPDFLQPQDFHTPRTHCTLAETRQALTSAICRFLSVNNGAGNETRTRDPNLGKVVLYQLSYSR